jgi:PAS domain S-box-containing protein
MLARPFSVSALVGCVSTLAEASRTVPDDDEEFARAAAEALPFPMVALDLDRRVRFWNAAAGRLFGWTLAEARGRILEDIVPSDLTPEQLRSIKADVRAGKIWHHQRFLQLRDGAVVRMLVTAAPLRDSAGRIIGHAAVFAEAAAAVDSGAAPTHPLSGARGTQPMLPTILRATSGPSLVRGRGHGEPPDARARRFAELVRAGHSLRQIAAREGISYERVRQVLARAGYRRDRDLKDPPAA